MGLLFLVLCAHYTVVKLYASSKFFSNCVKLNQINPNFIKLTHKSTQKHLNFVAHEKLVQFRLLHGTQTCSPGF